MASFLRQIVAGPRIRHPEAGLDLCYVTDNIIATSGPSQTYPQRAYRNPLDRLVEFLDAEHGQNWAIWEFRAEGTGYPDELVYNRINHYPWPDHHPPPFRLVPLIIASMRNWLNGNDVKPDNGGGDGDGDGDKSHLSEAQKKMAVKVINALKGKKDERVVVVHCKAGKGRSGTIACSYLVAECGWTPADALARFTERRMRPSFGPGVSIPSQVRWLGYVGRWTKGRFKYVDREIEIVEIHVWGLRHGVRLAVEGFVEQGRKIKVFHAFTRKERQIVEGNAPKGTGLVDMVYEMAGYNSTSPSASQTVEQLQRQQDAGGISNTGSKTGISETTQTAAGSSSPVSAASERVPIGTGTQPMTESSDAGSKQFENPKTEPTSPGNGSSEAEPGGMAVIFKPQEPIRLPNSDVNITIERRHRAPKSLNLTMVTSVAHVWFNAFFEGNGPEQDGVADDAGVFEIEWDKLDGIKGSSQKGTRAADRIAVVWKAIPPEEGGQETVAGLPSSDSPVPQMQAADWAGNNDEDPEKGKGLGLRAADLDGADDNSETNSSQREALGGTESGGKEDDDFRGA
ncbi:phosphatases II [Xylaria sp. CBS 124048]|nr:phosphatases II [Xylaria sp. CBS 124048]